MTELKDFLYELNQYAKQTHVLKDKYDKLSDKEKTIVMQHAPTNSPSLEQHSEDVFCWLAAMQEQMGITE